MVRFREIGSFVIGFRYAGPSGFGATTCVSLGFDFVKRVAFESDFMKQVPL